MSLVRANTEEAEESGGMLEANELWKAGAYVCDLTAVSLHGYEGFYLELARLQNHFVKGRLGVLPVPLNKSTLLTENMCKNSPM